MREMRSAAMAAMALGLIVTIAAPAAAKSPNARSLDLVRTAEASDTDALGDLRLRNNRKGETGRLRLSNLEPRTWYEVVDAASGDVLGEVRTNRRGKAKMKLRHRALSGKTRFDVPDSIEVRHRDTGETLLRVDTDGASDGMFDGAYGFAEYEGLDGHVAWVDMLSLPEAEVESFTLSLQPPYDPEATRDVWYELSAGTHAGELPLDVATVTELAGRAFRIVSDAGTVLVRGRLPEMERFSSDPRPLPPEWPDWDWGDIEEPWFPMPDGQWPGDDAGRPGVSERPKAAYSWGFLPADGVTNTVRDGSGAGFAMDFGDLFDLDLGDGLDWFTNLPELGDDVAYDDVFVFMPPDWMPFPMPEQERSDLVLQIADENGDLVDAGRLIRLSVERVDWAHEWPSCGFGGHDDGDVRDEPARDTPTGNDRTRSKRKRKR